MSLYDDLDLHDVVAELIVATEVLILRVDLLEADVDRLADDVARLTTRRRWWR
jgi:hypothetical protein